MVEHTPTPWIFDEVRTSCGRAFRIGNEQQVKLARDEKPRGLPSYAVLYDDYPGHPDNEAKANAAFIVECVNSHASLVEENERLRKALEPFGSGGNWGTVKAMIVNGATVPQNGVDLAKWLSSMNAKADAALGREP
jgi:hypothetical protein